MNEWWLALSALQQVMFVIGAATLLFMVVQIVMMLIGLGDQDISVEPDVSGLSDVGADIDTDIGTDIDADVSADVGDADADFDVSSGGMGDVGGDVGDISGAPAPVCPHPSGFHALGMRLLSLRCIIAFFCFGSWTVFIMDALMPWYFALIVGAAVGFVAAVIMAVIMNQLMKLQGDGTVKMSNCVGKEGEVYQTVPPLRGGVGKVNIFVQERYKEFDAMTDDDEAVSVGENVRVVKTDGNTLIVERVGDRNRQSRKDK